MNKFNMIYLFIFVFVLISSVSVVSYTGEPYWIKDSNIWIRTNVINKSFYVYYGGPTNHSDGDVTFSFFEDFNDATLNLTKWSYDGTYTLSNSYITISNVGDDFYSNDLFNEDSYLFIKGILGSSYKGFLGFSNTAVNSFNIFQRGYPTSGKDNGRSYDGTTANAYTLTTVYDGNTFYEFHPTTTGTCYYWINDSEFSLTDQPTYPLNIYVSRSASSTSSGDVSVDYIMILNGHNRPSISYGSETYGTWVLDNETYTKRRLITISTTDEDLDSQFFLDESYFSDNNLYISASIVNASEKVEQVTDQEQESNVTLSSASWQNIISGDFNLTNDNNISLAFTVNAINNFADSQLNCRINIDGIIYGSQVNRTMPVNQYGSFYLTTAAFELENGTHTVSLQCRRQGSWTYFTVFGSHGILKVLQDKTTEQKLNFKTINISSSITSTSYTLLGKFNFTTSNDDVDSFEHLYKYLVLDGHLQYNYDSTGTITTKIIIRDDDNTNFEFPRYGESGDSGSLGGLRLSSLIDNSSSQNITIELWGKSTTGDGSVSGNLVVDEIILHDYDINQTSLNNTYVSASSTYTPIKYLLLDNSLHSSSNLVVKTTIPFETTSGNARVKFRLRLDDENGSVIYRDIANGGEYGLAMIQDVFQISSDLYNVTLEATSNNNFQIYGGEFGIYTADNKPVIPETYKVTAVELNTNKTINNFSVKISSTNATFNTINGTVYIVRNGNALDDLEISSQGYFNRTYYDHNTSNDLNAELTSKNVTLTFYDAREGIYIDNATIKIEYPNSTTKEFQTDSNGNITFLISEKGEHIITFESYKGFISPVTFTRTFNDSNLPYTEQFNISTARININIYDRSTYKLLNGTNVSIIILGLLNVTVNNGSYTVYNKTLSSGTYTIQAIADGYSTEQQTFTYTNEEELTINLYLLNLTSIYAGTLYAEVIDEFNRKIPSATVELYEYSVIDKGFILVSQKLSNSNGEAVFNIELGKKTYVLKAYKDINGVLLTASTNEAGEIILTDQDVRNLILRTTDLYEAPQFDSLMYNITEDYNNNISTITLRYYMKTGIPTTVCIDYYKTDFLRTRVSNDCQTSSAGILQTNYSLDRDYYYDVEVYVLDNDDNKILLDTFMYPSKDSLVELTDENNYTKYILLLVFIVLLGLSLSMKNISLFLLIYPASTWLMKIIFPTVFKTSIAISITIISLFIYGISIKRQTQ